MDTAEKGEFFLHYGTKGMRWGFRRRNVPKQGPSKDAKRASAQLTKAKTSSVKSLTTKELKELNQRLEAEKKFGQLKPKTKIAIGVAAVLALAAGANKTMGFLNSPAGQAAIKQGQAFRESALRGAPASASEITSRLASLPNATMAVRSSFR